MRAPPDAERAPLADGGAPIQETDRLAGSTKREDTPSGPTYQAGLCAARDEAVHSHGSAEPTPGPPPIRSAAVDTLPEGADTYPFLVQVSDRLRVIECAARIQWILQRSTGTRWRDISYHRDRDVLIERCGPMSAPARATLRALPPYHLGVDA